MNPRLHRALGWLLLPLLVVLSWSGTLSLYRAELDQALTPALQTTMQHPPAVLPSQAQQFVLALTYQQQQDSQQGKPSAGLYLEFASARKPYLSVHLRAANSWQLQQVYLQLTDGQPLGPLQAVRPGPSHQQIGSWFFSLHYQFLGLLGQYGQQLALALALAALWLGFSGCWLCWRRRRQFSLTALSWHQWLGVLALPWLGWFYGSALFTQFGQWHPALRTSSSLSTSAYYAALFPQPMVSQGAAVATEAMPVAALPAVAAKVLQQAPWPVGKMQLDYSTGRFMLTQDVASQWQRGPQQLAQQSFSLSGELLPQAAYSDATVWQLRNWFYSLHQAAFAGPTLRLLLFLLGCATVLMLLAAAESVGRRLGGLWLLRTLTSGFVLASLLWLGWLWLWPKELVQYWQLIASWLLSAACCRYKLS